MRDRLRNTVKERERERERETERKKERERVWNIQWAALNSDRTTRRRDKYNLPSSSSVRDAGRPRQARQRQPRQRQPSHLRAFLKHGSMSRIQTQCAEQDCGPTDHWVLAGQPCDCIECVKGS